MIESTQLHGKYAKSILKLRPITPVHVWSGTNASVGIDAFIVKDDFYHVSYDIIEKLPPNVITRLPEIIKRSPAEAMREVFNSLFSLGALTPVAKVKVKPGPQTGQQVKLIHRDLIPGSTLKGYIRTAVLRALLTRMPRDKAIEVIKRGVDVSAEPKKVGVGLEAQLLRKARIRLQGGFVDAFMLIMVSDPIIKESKLSLRELRVVHVHNPSSVVARTLAITLDPSEKTKLEYMITVLAYPEEAELLSLARGKPEDLEVLREIVAFKSKFSQEFSSKEFLIEALREHGCRLLELERKRVHQTLRDYMDLLDDIKSRYCKEGQKCVPARVGYMAGRESKTIIDLIEDYTPDIYREIVELMSSSLRRIWDASTLKLVDFDGKLVGVGWCEICVE